MKRLTKNQFEWLDDFTVVAEASTVGFEPGEWPDAVVLEGEGLFRKSTPFYYRSGELESVLYENGDRFLTIFND